MITKSFQYGDHTVTLETGKIARQATGSVVLKAGDMVLLATVVGKKQPKPGMDFFPLTVNYQEKAYAAGQIPGSFFKREGRPGEHETLTSRLIDRPIRPLFPKGFKNDVQIVITVMSYDPTIQTDVMSIIAASAALSVSGLPFDGPVGAARVGYADGAYILNPSEEAVKESQLNLVVAGTKTAVLMVESEADQLSEDVMLGAVMFGHQNMQVAIDAINDLTKAGGKPRWDWKAEAKNEALSTKVEEVSRTVLEAAYQEQDKSVRVEKIKAARDVMQTAITEAGMDEFSEKADHIFHDIEKDIVRKRIMANEPRIDGRDRVTVRPITPDVNFLPRSHGSAVFTRGETQAIVTTTLGTDRDAQLKDLLSGTFRDKFMLHYNFPPYSVGETGMMGSPKRREIGHGYLAKRAIAAVLPDVEKTPYTIRIVSEITESNGSSSMATVCGASMALMDAGIAIKAPVAGIAMGLIKEGDDFAVLTDILGDEDHLGDMDFKVAGSSDGVTALQMDIKIQGITEDIMKQALAQAKDARLHILGIMNQVIDKPRTDLSANAPRIMTMQINPDKIREVIGKGGATIRSLTEETNTQIDLTDEGLVTISAQNAEDADAAKEKIEDLVADVEVGAIYEGPIVKMMDFGAFVSLLPGKQGMVHVSQIMEERVENIHDFLEEGQIIRVKVTEIDRQGRVRLSMKEIEQADGNVIAMAATEAAVEAAPEAEADQKPEES
jgi:polyribonucleotide nucleotidyltransferase